MKKIYYRINLFGIQHKYVIERILRSLYLYQGYYPNESFKEQLQKRKELKKKV